MEEGLSGEGGIDTAGNVVGHPLCFRQRPEQIPDLFE
jgi:hypothetical protein